MKKHLKLPKFKNEDEERDFWSKINLADYYEAKDFKHVPFPNLKTTGHFYTHTALHTGSGQAQGQ
ncbi:MAG: CopG family antitoxin [Patescibacteria group bacterium]